MWLHHALQLFEKYNLHFTTIEKLAQISFYHIFISRLRSNTRFITAVLIRYSHARSLDLKLKLMQEGNLSALNAIFSRRM